MSPTERITLVVMILLSYSFICGYFAWQYRIRQRQSSLSNPQNSVNVLGDKFFLVAYASQSGTAEAIARRSVIFLDKNFQYKLLPLNQVNQEILANSHSALFVVSTYGEGEPPDNATAFNRQYLSNAAAIDLSHLTFSVLALGDRMYERFCAFGHQLHQGLCQLGATPLLQPMEACATDQAGEEVPYGPIFKQWLSRLGLAQEQESHDLINGSSQSLLTPLSMALFTPWKITERVQLNLNSTGAPLYKVCLESPDISGLTWQAGDLVEIHFKTPPSSGQNNAQAIHKRKYSIASIPSDGSIELLVRQHYTDNGILGLGSGALTKHLAIGSLVSLKICTNSAFHGPESTRPMILIGNGSGLAGLRAHLKARVLQQASANWLIFGERQRQHDSLLLAETQHWQQTGYLTRIDRVFSRDSDIDSNSDKYVQDRLLRCADELRQWVEQGAAIYVCGSLTGMAKGVDLALQNILGEALYRQIQRQNLYRRDVY